MNRIAVIFLLALPAWLLGFDSGLAQASQSNGGFCQITEASMVAQRAGMRGPRTGIRLLTNHREIEAGEVVSARLVNFSSMPEVFDAEFEVQRNEGTGWRTDPSSPDGPWPRSARKLRPGGAGGCYRYVVPKGQPGGRYRFLTRVSNRPRRHAEVAEFRINARAPGQGFCKTGPVKDYLKPLRLAAPVHELPASRKLSFAPPGLIVFPIGSLVVGRGVVGLGLADEAINWPRRLNWIIRASLIRVDAEGKELEAIQRKRERIGTRKLGSDESYGPRFAVPGAPASYRVDITFESFKGRVLGRYSEYFRVMKPSYRVRMAVNSRVVEPGDVLRARIENLGTEMVLADLAPVVQKFIDGRWIAQRTIPYRGRSVDGRARVYGGQAGHCFPYRIPAEFGEGKYRIQETLQRSLKDRAGEGRIITARFGVVGSLRG